jgi:hypothetical protein
MGYTLTYRSCQPVSPEQEATVRAAADAFNQGRAWVLTFLRDERDDHMSCFMEPSESPGGEPPGEKPPLWPGAYEGKCLLDGLCGISRDCQVDWEIHEPYGLRPVGYIRGGVCHADREAQIEAARNMVETRRQRAGQ